MRLRYLFGSVSLGADLKAEGPLSSLFQPFRFLPQRRYRPFREGLVHLDTVLGRCLFTSMCSMNANDERDGVEGE